MNIIPPVLAIVLPVGAAFAQKLSKDHLPVLANAAIATVIFVIAAVMWAMFAQSLTPDPANDLLLIAGYIAALAVDPTMKPLYALVIEAIHPATIVTAAPPASTAPSAMMLSTPPTLRASRAQQQPTAPTQHVPVTPPRVEIIDDDHSGAQ